MSWISVVMIHISMWPCKGATGQDRHRYVLKIRATPFAEACESKGRWIPLGPFSCEASTTLEGMNWKSRWLSERIACRRELDGHMGWCIGGGIGPRDGQRCKARRDWIFPSYEGLHQSAHWRVLGEDGETCNWIEMARHKQARQF